MYIEQAPEDLRTLGLQLFSVAEELGAEEPRRSGDYYRVSCPAGGAVYLRFVGKSARTSPANSIHLSAGLTDELSVVEGVTSGNNWYGKASADLFVRPGWEEDVHAAHKFLEGALNPKKWQSAKQSLPADSTMQQQRSKTRNAERSPFPLHDTASIREFANLYWAQITAGEAADERKFEQEFADARSVGFVTRDLFLRAARWKSPRPTRYYQQNTEAKVRAATGGALKAQTDAEAISALTELRGVALRTASALLHFIDPDRYPVLDVRVVAALGEGEPRSWEDPEYYDQIASRLRKLAAEHGVELRTLDRALWTWDKVHTR